MSSLTIEQFARSLAENDLLTMAEVAMFLDGYPVHSRPRDAMALARELVHANRLTRYQATILCQGHGKELRFDEYVVLDKIGQGGMGVVLKAQHRRMRRLVAIKMLPQAMLENAESVRRFYHEVEAVARLSHPNIVTAYDAREQNKVHYLIMEYVDGHNLATILKQYGPLPLHQAIKCTLQAARGLDYAHSQGVVHRDIKPGNLLIDKHGVVKILDMGLARIQREVEMGGGSERLTQSGQVMGTCDYMAPEQAEDARRADHRSDIYALGCTLFRLLTGRTPYVGETIMQVLLAQREAPIPSLTTARPDAPPQLDTIFRKMVAKRPENRYQSMGEVVVDLEAVSAARHAASQSSATKRSSDSDFRALLRTLGNFANLRHGKAGSTRPSASKTALSDTNVSSPRKAFPGGRKRTVLIGLALGLGLTMVASLLWMVWGGRTTLSARSNAVGPSLPISGSNSASNPTSPVQMAEDIVGQNRSNAMPGPTPTAPPRSSATPKRSLAEMASEISGKGAGGRRKVEGGASGNQPQ